MVGVCANLLTYSMIYLRNSAITHDIIMKRKIKLVNVHLVLDYFQKCVYAAISTFVYCQIFCYILLT